MALSLASLSCKLTCFVVILGIAKMATAFIQADGYVYHPEIQTSYKLFPTLLSWSNARLACQHEGGRLAVIDTSQKIGFIISHIQPGTNFWVGIMRDNILSPWVDVDGDQVSTLLPWGSCGILNTGTLFHGGCVTVSDQSTGLCTALCLIHKPYICEKPGARDVARNIHFAIA